MPSQELINYIATSRKQGVNDDTLRLILRESGWDDTVISQALAAAPRPALSFHLPISSLFLNKLLFRLSHSKLKIAGVLLIFFFSGTAFAAYQYYHSPNVLMKRAVGNIQGIKTLHFSFVSTYDFMAADSMNEKIKSSENVSGDVDLSDSKNPKFNVTTALTEKESGQTITDVQAKVMYINSKLYFNFIKLLFGPSSPEMNEIENDVENTWYFLDKKTLQNTQSLYPDTFSASSVTAKPEGPSLQQTILNNVTDSKKRQLIQAALKYKIFTTTKKPDEKINGVAAYHLHYVINQDQTIAFFMEYDKINKTKNPTTKAEWEKVFQDLSKDNLLQGDIWLGKSDLYPYKLVLNMNGDADANGKKIIMPITLTLSNFNKSITFTPPANAKDAAPIIRSFLQQQFGEPYNSGYGENDGYNNPTPTPIYEPFVIQGVIFYDLNGNGKKDLNEGVVKEGLNINIYDETKNQYLFQGGTALDSGLYHFNTNFYVKDDYTIRVSPPMCYMLEGASSMDTIPLSVKDMGSYFFAYQDIPLQQIPNCTPSPPPVNLIPILSPSISPTQSPLPITGM